jgi:hypothetical protein
MCQLSVVRSQCCESRVTSLQDPSALAPFAFHLVPHAFDPEPFIVRELLCVSVVNDGPLLLVEIGMSIYLEQTALHPQFSPRDLCKSRHLRQ